MFFTSLLTIGTLSSSAQSFWKTSGNETHENALHSGILYLPGNEAIFVSTYNMGIFRSKNKGTTWDHVLVLPKNQPITAMFTSNNGVIFGGGKGRIYRSESDGDKWEEIPVDFTTIRDFTEDKNGHLYLCSVDSGGILKSEDNGISWTEHNTGLPDKYVNNLISDKNGNMFCSLMMDRNGYYGGLFSWDELQNKWVKREIRLKIENTNYVIKVSSINDMNITSDGEILISLDGVAANFGVFGLFKNSVSGAIASEFWNQENWNDTIQSPFSMIMDDIFLTSTGNIFASRISDGSGIYAKMVYSGKWNRYSEGIPRGSLVKGYFCETQDGLVYLTTESSNKILITTESVPGKKYFQIKKGQLQPMKLYEFQTIHATSPSGMDVKFKSMDINTSIEGNILRAVGIGFSVIKVFTEGNDSLYYSEEDMALSIAKAENAISVEPLGKITEGDSVYLSAHSNSGEEVFFKMIHGNAWFIKNRLEYAGPGKILFMMTEPGNDSYEPADTVQMELCINPLKPVISADTLSGTVRLNSSSTNNNNWYVNNNFSGTAKTIIPVAEGIYTLQVVTDGCFSEFSSSYHYISTYNETVSSENFTVFPILFRDKLSIKKKIIADIKMQYRIIDISGKVLKSSEQEGDLIILDMASLLPGWYILEITLNQNSDYFKIFKSL